MSMEIFSGLLLSVVGKQYGEIFVLIYDIHLILPLKL